VKKGAGWRNIAVRPAIQLSLYPSCCGGLTQASDNRRAAAAAQPVPDIAMAWQRMARCSAVALCCALLSLAVACATAEDPHSSSDVAAFAGSTSRPRNVYFIRHGEAYKNKCVRGSTASKRICPSLMSFNPLSQGHRVQRQLVRPSD
jgi:hypothetical protein